MPVGATLKCGGALIVPNSKTVAICVWTHQQRNTVRRHGRLSAILAPGHNEADKTLTQRYEAALIPNAEGTEAKVSVSLAGDELKFVATSATGERADTVYRRAK